MNTIAKRENDWHDLQRSKDDMVSRCTEVSLKRFVAWLRGDGDCNDFQALVTRMESAIEAEKHMLEKHRALIKSTLENSGCARDVY